MPFILFFAIFILVSCITNFEICNAKKHPTLGKLGIENPFFPESCKSTCPEDKPNSVGKEIKILKLCYKLNLIPI